MTSGDLHDQWGPDLRWLICKGRLDVFTVFSPVPESSSCLPGVLFGSQAFLAMRWTMPGMALEKVTS
jgi:hypothetical protein